ncbi:MAG: hypothetical protein KTV77_02930 [Wolbachia endosymbiont of Fragariocoptes setiger]|nr:hypothetical protein [Wolbachia endosymbiont of Fragariocoptes setiger]
MKHQKKLYWQKKSDTQATIAASNISDKPCLGISHENRCILINELRADSSCDEMQIKRNHFIDLQPLSEANESCHFTPIVNKDKRDATTKLKVLVQNQETSNKLRKLFERGIPGYKLNLVIHLSIITLNQYDYSYNNSLKDIESYSKYTLINTDIQKDKTTKLSIIEHNNSLNNQLTTPLENRSDKKSSSVTYTHTQKDSKITKSIASGIGFVTGSFLGIAIVMLVTELPFFAFTFVSALVGAIIGYGVATLYEKISEKRGKNTEVNTCTILKDVSTLECFKGNSNKFEAHVS